MNWEMIGQATGVVVTVAAGLWFFWFVAEFYSMREEVRQLRAWRDQHALDHIWKWSMR